MTHLWLLFKDSSCNLQFIWTLIICLFLLLRRVPIHIWDSSTKWDVILGQQPQIFNIKQSIRLTLPMSVYLLCLTNPAHPGPLLLSSLLSTQSLEVYVLKVWPWVQWQWDGGTLQTGDWYEVIKSWSHLSGGSNTVLTGWMSSKRAG